MCWWVSLSLCDASVQSGAGALLWLVYAAESLWRSVLALLTKVMKRFLQLNKVNVTHFFLPPCDIFWQVWLVFLRQVTEKHDVMQQEWSDVLLIPLHTLHTQVKINSFSRPLPVVIQHLRILGWVVCCIFELSSQVEGLISVWISPTRSNWNIDS